MLIGENNCYVETRLQEQVRNGILFPKLFWPSLRKNCICGGEELWKSKLKAKNFQKLEQFIQTVNGQNNFW